MGRHSFSEDQLQDHATLVALLQDHSDSLHSLFTSSAARRAFAPAPIQQSNQAYRMDYLLQCLRLGNLLSDDASLRLAVEHSLRIALPASHAKVAACLKLPLW